MKLVCSYSNCQGTGLIHFLKQSRLAERYEFSHYNNYQIILREQSPEALLRDAARADIFIYQETPAIKYFDRSTEQMISNVVPKDALKLSFGYGFNHGFFPICHHGQWQTGRQVLKLAKEDPFTLLAGYDYGTLHFDCALRFVACLAEQMLREKTCDVKMADFILSHFRKEQLFICENHPASAYFSQLASRFLRAIDPVLDEPLPYATTNDANLPCGMLVHQAVVNELALEYQAEAGAHKYFGEFLNRFVNETKAA